MPKGKTVHVYCNPNGMLIGADWDLKDVHSEFESHPDSIEIGGEMCRRMGHAIVVHRNDGPWFFANDKAKLDKFDPQTEEIEAQ